MVQKIHPRGVIWVPSSSHPVVILAPLNSPMWRPSIKKSVYKHPKIKKFALNLQLRTIQVLTNDAQVLIFCLLILLLLYKNPIESYPYDYMYGSKFICSTGAKSTKLLSSAVIR